MLRLYSTADLKDCTQGLEGLSVVIRKLDEILKYRVEATLAAISDTCLVKLPAVHALPCEEIMTSQAEFISKQTHSLAKRYIFRLVGS